jgi:ketosteroid isomerase-like protein
MRSNAFLAFGLAMLVAAVVKAQDLHSNDVTTIRELSSQQQPPRASSDIFWSGAYPKPLVGRTDSASRAADAARFAVRQNQSVTHETVRLDVSSAGDMAYEFYNFTLSFDRSDTKQHVSFPGSGLRVWKKLNGHWQIVADVLRPWEQAANPLEGAWTIVARSYAGPDTSYTAGAVPSVIIYAGNQFSTTLGLSNSRKASYTGESATTDAQKASLYDTFGARAGTFQIRGDTIVTHVTVAKFPGNEGLEFKSTFRIKGDTLYTTTTSGISADNKRAESKSTLIRLR